MGATLDEIEIKISQDSKGASKAIDSLISSLEKLGKATDMSQTADKMKNLSKSVISLSNATKTLEGLSKFATWGFSLGYLGKKIEETVLSATKYTQILNNSRTVMGEASKDAEELADKLGNTLMLNPSQVMEFQTTFQNLFTGFGNTAKNAQIMSQNLTQLSYDMASFYEQLDKNPEAGMEKLRLAMAGTIEPLQRLGYALKEADLQAVAARQGLKVNVRNLNSASKSMLRYIAIMEQSERVQGNLAKTFDSPATAMLVLKQAMGQLSNEIGKTFLPMVMAAIPYIQALVKGVINMVKTINGILGIELPTIEGWDKAKEGMASVGEEADNTGKAIKKAFTMGIDELNVFDSSTSSAAEGMQDITGLLKLPEYDMTEGFNAEKLQEIEDKLKPLEPLFAGLATVFAGFYEVVKGFVDNNLYPWLVDMGDWMKNNPETLELIGKGLGIVALGLLGLKALGGLVNFLGLPLLITKLHEAKKAFDKLKTVYAIDGTVTTGWGLLADKILKVGAFALLVWASLKLVGDIIDLVTGTGDKWQNLREIIGGVVVVGSALAVVLGVVAGLPAVILIAASLLFAYIATHFEKFIGNLGTVGELISNLIGNVGLWIGEFFYSFYTTLIKALAMMATAILGWLPAIGKQISSRVMNWFSTLIKGLWDKLSETKFGKWLEEKMGIGDKIDIAIEATEEMENFGKNWEEAANKASDKLVTTLDKGKEFYEEMRGALDIDTSKNIDKWQKYVEEGEAKISKHESETDAKGLIEKIVELTKGNGEDDITQKIEDANTKVTEVLEKQDTSKQMQEQFNTDSLANDKATQEIITNANKLIENDTKATTSQMSTMLSQILNAIQRVEDACRDIRINVHYHISGGGDGYATGGTPRRGEYFYAREDGLPEMVGRVGRQTTIMNNGQIADTMAESMVRAMSQSEATSEPTVIENKLYLDGEVVYTNQEKIKRSKGYSFGLGGFANV